MKTRLEQMCTMIDRVLAKHGLEARVAGGYVAGNGLLFSLSDNTLLDTVVRHDLKQALQARDVASTVGVVLVDAGRPAGEDVIEGEFVEIVPGREGRIETVDIIDLILEHEKEGRGPAGGARLLPSGRHKTGSHITAAHS